MGTAARMSSGLRSPVPMATESRHPPRSRKSPSGMQRSQGACVYLKRCRPSMSALVAASNVALRFFSYVERGFEDQLRALGGALGLHVFDVLYLLDHDDVTGHRHGDATIWRQENVRLLPTVAHKTAGHSDCTSLERFRGIYPTEQAPRRFKRP